MINSLARIGIFSIFIGGLSVTQAQSEVIKYCVDPNWMPYEAIRDGKHVGMSKDYLDLISQHTNFNFELVATSSWSESLRYVRRGDCDLVPMANVTPERRAFLDFSQPYFEAPNALVTRVDEPAIPGLSAISNQLVGVPTGYRMSEYIARYYPHIAIYEVDNEQQGLALLVSKDIDVMVGSLLSVTAHINTQGFDALMVSGYTEVYDRLAIGVSDRHSEWLVDLNQAIRHISESEHVSIYKRWYQVMPIKKSPPNWYWASLFLLVLLVLLALWVTKQQRALKQDLSQRNAELEALQAALLEKNRTVEFLAIHDDTTSLNNRNFMVQKLEDELSRCQRFNSPATLVLMSITPDAVNLTAKITDPLIGQLAKIASNRIRDVDVAARWTHDEILILCPQTTLLSAQILAEHILTEVELKSLNAFNHFRVHIGMTSAKADDTLSKWTDRSHQALSMAKKKSENSYYAI